MPAFSLKARFLEPGRPGFESQAQHLLTDAALANEFTLGFGFLASKRTVRIEPTQRTEVRQGVWQFFLSQLFDCLQPREKN